MSFTIQWTAEGCVVQVYDPATSRDIENLLHQLGSSPSLDQLHFVLHDLSRVTETDIDPSVVEFSAYTNAAVSSYKPHLKEAFVVRAKPMEAYVRQYIDHCKEAGCTWQFGVFQSMQEAQEWIHSSTAA